MAEVPVEFVINPRIVLAAGASSTWWHAWFAFDEARGVYFDVSPDQALGMPGDMMAVQVTEQWTRRRPGFGTQYIVTYTNRGNVPCTFRPRMTIVPAFRYGGGGSGQ